MPFSGFSESVLSVIGPSARSLYGSREFQQLLTRCLQQNIPGWYCTLTYKTVTYLDFNLDSEHYFFFFYFLGNSDSFRNHYE